MLAPRKIKYRKPQKGRMTGLSKGGNYVAFGTHGLKALEAGWITSRQTEAVRITISRRVRKVGKMWIRIFPHKSITEVLDIARINLSEVDVIAVYWQPWRIFSRALGTTKKILNSYESREVIFDRLKSLSSASESTGDGSWADLFRLKKVLTEIDKHR